MGVQKNEIIKSLCGVDQACLVDKTIAVFSLPQQARMPAQLISDRCKSFLHSALNCQKLISPPLRSNALPTI
jgi:hypothetical protein